MEIRVMISEIRRGLGRPHEAELGDSDILMEIWQAVTFYRSRLSLTHEAWQISQWEFDITTGSPSVRDITPADFNSAIFVTTLDDSNPYHITRTINVVKPEQVSMYYSGPGLSQTGGMWWGPHAAQVFTIYNKDGKWKIEWAPQHSEAARYKLWYTPGAAIVPPLYDDTLNFPLEEQNFYIIADCVVNLMPFITDRDKGMNLQQQGLVAVATKKMQQWEPVFQARMWDGPRREATQRRRVFGQSRSGRSEGFF